MNKFMPFVSVETFNPAVSPQNHLAQLMQIYDFNQEDLTANRAGTVTARQLEAMKGFQSSKLGVILLILIVLIALPLLRPIFDFIPPEVIVVSAIFVPILLLWLLIDLFRNMFAGKGSVQLVEGYLQLDNDTALSNGRTAYTYLNQSQTNGMMNRYHRIGLVRRFPHQSGHFDANTCYRVYYFKRGSLSYVLSLEPLGSAA